LRYTRVSDNSGHNYIIPFHLLRDWNLFCSYEDEDERGWAVPDWADRIDGGRLTFTNPNIEYDV
jgi:hypothetical protein